MPFNFEHEGVTQYAVRYVLWSKIGDTPVTRREGAYCDIVLEAVGHATDPKDAKRKLAKLLRATDSAWSGFFNMETYPNQNARTEFLNKGTIND